MSGYIGAFKAANLAGVDRTISDAFGLSDNIYDTKKYLEAMRGPEAYLTARLEQIEKLEEKANGVFTDFLDKNKGLPANKRQVLATEAARAFIQEGMLRIDAEYPENFNGHNVAKAAMKKQKKNSLLF